MSFSWSQKALQRYFPRCSDELHSHFQWVKKQKTENKADPLVHSYFQSSSKGFFSAYCGKSTGNQESQANTELLFSSHLYLWWKAVKEGFLRDHRNFGWSHPAYEAMGRKGVLIPVPLDRNLVRQSEQSFRYLHDAMCWALSPNGFRVEGGNNAQFTQLG